MSQTTTLTDQTSTLPLLAALLASFAPATAPVHRLSVIEALARLAQLFGRVSEALASTANDTSADAAELVAMADRAIAAIGEIAGFQAEPARGAITSSIVRAVLLAYVGEERAEVRESLAEGRAASFSSGDAWCSAMTPAKCEIIAGIANSPLKVEAEAQDNPGEWGQTIRPKHVRAALLAYVTEARAKVAEARARGEAAYDSTSNAWEAAGDPEACLILAGIASHAPQVEATAQEEPEAGSGTLAAASRLLRHLRCAPTWKPAEEEERRAIGREAEEPAFVEAFVPRALASMRDLFAERTNAPGLAAENAARELLLALPAHVASSPGEGAARLAAVQKALEDRAFVRSFLPLANEALWTILPMKPTRWLARRRSS